MSDINDNGKGNKNDDHIDPIDRIDVNPHAKPFTKYRAIELIICGICVILGLLYMYAHVLTLSILLPVYAVAFTAIPILQYLGIREGGKPSFAACIPTIFWSIMAVAVIVAMIAYFVNY